MQSEAGASGQLEMGRGENERLVLCGHSVPPSVKVRMTALEIEGREVELQILQVPSHREMSNTAREPGAFWYNASTIQWDAVA